MPSLRRIEQLERSIELEKCFRLQQKLAAMSQKYENKRFRDLYNLTYWEPLVSTALKIVRTRKGARTSGVDGKNKHNTNDDKLRAEICRELKTDTIQPSPLRLREIPKDNGDTRKLLIPTYKDRVVLTILKLILEPIYEPTFDASSYGFRPNFSTHDAIAEIKQFLGPSRRYAWIAETDIQSCFPSIPKSRLIAVMQDKIADGKILQLVRKYLHAGMAFEGYPMDREDQERDCGCPQGSPLSPLLCNVYLDRLDKFVNRKLHRQQTELERSEDLSPKPANVRRRRSYLAKKLREERTGPFHLIRYADDLVIVSPAKKRYVEEYLEQVKEFAWRELRLKLAPQKTAITHAADGFCFLGFRLKRIYRKEYDKYQIMVTVDPKRKTRHQKTIRKLLKGGQDREVASLITATNQRVRGWRNYYQKSVTNCACLHYIDQLAFWLLVKWLMKKFKAPISKVFNTFYKRIIDHGHDFKTLVQQRIYLEKAVWALPKHQMDYYHKHRHPWIEGSNPTHMPTKAFPELARPPTWDGKWHYGENYAKMMRKALQRDHYRCIKCGSTQDLNVHHINKRKSFQNPRSRPANCLENLATLCRNCHKFADRLSAIDCLNWLLTE